MAPPTTTPRLCDLTSADCADAVVSAVTERIGRYAFHLEPTISVHVPNATRVERVNCDLGLTVQQLTHWTQSLDGGDWPDASCARDALSTVLEQLQTPAHGRERDYRVSFASSDDELRDPIEVLVSAAWCRVQLEDGHAVSTRSLAALASVNRRRVNQLLADGEIKRTRDGTVTPLQARRLLAARVVGVDVARQLERAQAAVRYCCGDGRAWLVVTGEIPAATIATAEGWERRGREWIVRAA